MFPALPLEKVESIQKELDLNIPKNIIFYLWMLEMENIGKILIHKLHCKSVLHYIYKMTDHSKKNWP